MQRHEIRKKYNLQGSFLGDLARSCCCALCELTQAAKESELREKELGSSGGQYAAADSMVYAPKA
jgi:hypothetical protein